MADDGLRPCMKHFISFSCSTAVATKAIFPSTGLIKTTDLSLKMLYTLVRTSSSTSHKATIIESHCPSTIDWSIPSVIPSAARLFPTG